MEKSLLKLVKWKVRESTLHFKIIVKVYAGDQPGLAAHTDRWWKKGTRVKNQQMDKIGLERDEHNGKSFPFFFFQNQSPGSHAKRIVFLNRKILKKRLYYIRECTLQSFVSTVRINLIYSVRNSNIHLVEKMKRTKMGGGNSEPCLLLLLNSCPCWHRLVKIFLDIFNSFNRLLRLINCILVLDIVLINK